MQPANMSISLVLLARRIQLSHPPCNTYGHKDRKGMEKVHYETVSLNNCITNLPLVSNRHCGITSKQNETAIPTVKRLKIDAKVFKF